jgi:8-oxo-dGTP diphosphatase
MRERVCAAILRDDAILMVRIDYGDRVNLTLPGGGVDAGETHEQALVREVAEEANVIGRVIRRLYTRRVEQGWGDVRETCYLVEIAVDQTPVPGHNPGYEDQRFVEAVARRPAGLTGSASARRERGLTLSVQATGCALIPMLQGLLARPRYPTMAYTTWMRSTQTQPEERRHNV